MASGDATSGVDPAAVAVCAASCFLGFQRWDDVCGDGCWTAARGSCCYPGSSDGYQIARDLRVANRTIARRVDRRGSGKCNDDRHVGRDRVSCHVGCGFEVASVVPWRQSVSATHGKFWGSYELNLPDFSSRTPKVVAMDLDETTLNSSARLSDRTRAALHAVHNSGLPMVIATSRPERVLGALVGEDILEITSLVQMNGTLTVGRAGLTGSRKYLMDMTDAQRCWDLANELAPWARMTVEVDGIQFAVNHDDGINELWAFDMTGATVVVSIEEALRLGPAKVSINGMEQSLEPLAKVLEDELSDQTVIFRTASQQFLNVVPRQASKSRAVADLLQTANISLEDVLSFGDDFVDIGLIRDCGWSVAVENAIPEIKVLAKFSTASNDDDGVAIVLEKLVAALD